MESQIRVVVGQREGRSYLRSLYVTPPFRMVSVGQLQRDGALYLMQMSTSPGVLSGDRYDIRVELEPKTRLQLKSQSYQRLFDMEGEATQQMEIVVGEDSHFSSVPHPLVPHRNSSFSTHTRVTLGRGASILQSEIVTCGRRHHGEEFEFRDLRSGVEVYDSQGLLRLKDLLWLSPSRMPLGGCGLLEGMTHQGTLIYQCSERLPEKIVEQIYDRLNTVEGLKFGLSMTHYPGLLIRALGGGGEQLFGAFLAVQEILWDYRE